MFRWEVVAKAEELKENCKQGTKVNYSSFRTNEE